MSREVRRVPADWEHPKNDQGKYIPLNEGYAKALADYTEGAAQWEKGFVEGFGNDAWVPKGEEELRMNSYWDYAGYPPDPADYMPEWDESQKTHYQMYESVTEGTPISPPRETPESLAQWLTNNKANAGSYDLASYEEWYNMILAGSTCGSGTFIPATGQMMNGVQAITYYKNAVNS